VANRGFFHGSTLAKSTAPVATVPRCGACGLYKLCKSPKMPVTGQGRAGILIVGEAPGKDEDEQNRQFVGKTGRLLRGILEEYGLAPDRDCWWTNSLICRPPENAEPTDEQIDYCLPNLHDTIKTYKPTKILTFGAAACNAVVRRHWLGDFGAMGRWVGWRVPAGWWGHPAWLCPTWHPSYVARAEDNDERDAGLVRLWFKRHIEAALALPAPVPIPDYRAMVRLCTPEEAAAWIDRAIAWGGPVAFDYETNMLKPDGPMARIASASVCAGGRRTIAYPWHGAAIAATQRLLAAPNPKVASNLKFEERWSLKMFGHGVRNWAWDTMLAGHVADNRQGVCSIKFQSFVRLGVPTYNEHIEPFLRANSATEANEVLRQIELKDLLLYNGLDSLLEYLVALLQMEELGWPGNTRQFMTSFNPA
jgi:uracil-DNA glycosylase family 4